jgi:hypothetical protein
MRATLCIGCGRAGTVVCVQSNALLSPVSVSSGFYLRVARSRLGVPEVVCEKCDSAVGF